MKAIRTVSAFGVAIFVLGMMLPSRALAGPVVVSDVLADPAPLVMGEIAADPIDLASTFDSTPSATIVENTFTAATTDRPILINSADAGVVTPAADAVPEPATLVLLGTGLLGLAATLRARRR